MTFAAGETSRTVTVTAVGDAVVELDEAFRVGLSAPVNARLGAVTSVTGTIVNDDWPVVSVVASGANRTEGSSTATPQGTTAFTFTVTRTSGVGTASVNWAVAHGTTDAADFAGALSGTVAFAAGQTSQVVTVAVRADTEIELDEAFSVVLSSPVQATLGTATAAATVVNDDWPVVSIATADVSRVEGAAGTTTVYTYTVSRSSAVGTSQVAWGVTHVGTTAADFTGVLSGTVAFAAGQTSQVVTVTVAGDADVELSESFRVGLSVPVNARLGTSSVTSTIANDDWPVVEIAAVQADRAEGSSTTVRTGYTFAVTRSSGVGTSSATWAVVHGTTVAADFYGSTSGTVTFAAGETSKTVTVYATGDTAVEADEAFAVRLTGAQNATLGAQATAGGVVRNDDAAVVSIVATGASRAEGTGAAATGYTFTVTRTSGLYASTVDWAVVHGTTDAEDFAGPVSGTVAFAVGETSKVITVGVVADATIELGEAFAVALSNPTGATLGAAATAAGAVLNDDWPAVGIATADVSRVEGGAGTTTVYTYVITRESGVGTSQVTWGVTHVGTTAADFTGALSGVVTFAAGETSRTVTVTAVGDAVVELDEAFRVGLSAPVNARLGTVTSVTGTIVNDDWPVVSVVAASADRAEGSSGTTAFTFTVSRTSGVGGSTVDWAVVHGTTSAADFSGLTSGTITFNPGELTRTVTVQVAGDTAIEGDETFSVVLGNPARATLGTTTAQGIIRNDDRPILRIAATEADRTEGTGGTTPFTFTVTRDVGTGASSVDWAVTHGSTAAADFTGPTSGTLVFAEGETSKVITLSVVGDSVGEGNELFSVTLSNAVGATVATSFAGGTIRNDDSGGVGGIHGSVQQVTYITTPADVDDSIDNLVGDAKWGGSQLGSPVVLTYSFSSAASTFSYTDPTHTPQTELNASQQAAARQAMAAVAAICNITFVEVADTETGAGDIRWTRSLNTTLSTAHAYYPSRSAAGGDVWIGPSSAYTNPVVGGYSYQTFIHELGHALGLEHPHDGSPAPETGEDQLKYSVMSYKDHATDTNDGYGSSYFPTNFMLNDISALQYLYGVNTTANQGDTVYRWATGARVYECLWDVGGNDTLDASNQTLGCTLNLNNGTWSSIGATYSNQAGQVRNSLGIAQEVTGVSGVENLIENAIGSALADTLVGNRVANTLTGGGGADTLTGGAGADVFRFVTTAEGGDTLTDFTSGTDRIQVVSANFGLLPAGTLAAARFVAGVAPVAADGSAAFLYDGGTGQLVFDANGSAAGGTTLIATLASGSRTLVASDIQVVVA